MGYHGNKNLPVFNLQYLFVCLSITSAYIYRVIFFSDSSLSIPGQIKCQKPRIIHTFVHRFLLHREDQL